MSIAFVIIIIDFIQFSLFDINLLYQAIITLYVKGNKKIASVAGVREEIDIMCISVFAVCRNSSILIFRFVLELT